MRQSKYLPSHRHTLGKLGGGGIGGIFVGTNCPRRWGDHFDFEALLIIGSPLLSGVNFAQQFYFGWGAGNIVSRVEVSDHFVLGGRGTTLVILLHGGVIHFTCSCFLIPHSSPSRGGFTLADKKDKVRYGAVRCGAVRCGAVRCGTVRYGKVRHLFICNQCKLTIRVQTPMELHTLNETRTLIRNYLH